MQTKASGLTLLKHRKQIKLKDIVDGHLMYRKVREHKYKALKDGIIKKSNTCI